MIIQKKHLALLSLLVLALTFSGCGVPQQQYDAVEAELASVQNEYETTKAELASLQSEVKKLQDELTAQSATLTKTQDSNDTLQKQNNTLQEEISELENRLSAILDTDVVQYYEFSYQFVMYNWTLPIPLGTYFYYKDIPRPVSYSGYARMTTDPDDDDFIARLVRNIDEAAYSNDLTKIEVINFVAKFVQDLPHTEDDVKTPYDGYPRYPIETLFDRGGDSEDTAILAAALLNAMGYDVALLFFDEQKHMAIGINIPKAVGYRWQYQGNKYFHLETTDEGWQLGSCPSAYREASPHISPVGS